MVASLSFQPEAVGGDACVLQQHVQARQLGRARRELLDALVAREIQLPHLDDAAAPRAGLDVCLGLLALLEAPARKYHLRRVHFHQVPRRLEAQPDICTCHNHRLALEAHLWERRLREVLDVEEIGEIMEERHFVSAWISLLQGQSL
jgi:hypothetical protein